MSDVLERICADKYNWIAECKARTRMSELERRAGDQAPPRGFHAALEARAEEEGFGLICEIKKASPSKGLIREDFDPSQLARDYLRGGAACLSVLTDKPYFQGEDRHLETARAAVDLPILRKDFMLDPYQVFEARALGADCILLIIAALSRDQADELEEAARELEMDVLIEVHDEHELEEALLLKSPLIGINNRNLKTLEVSLDTTRRLASQVGQDRLLVCESGLKDRGDLLEMAEIGARAFLIGESLMRQENVAEAAAKLRDAVLEAE